jgi:hypothetical protein
MSFQQFLLAYMANLTDGFSPELTTGLVSWLDAADANTIEFIGNGAFANSWYDKALPTRYGRAGVDEGSQNSIPRYYATGRNGKPSLRWDADNGVTKYYYMSDTKNLPTGTSNSSILAVGYYGYDQFDNGGTILAWGNTSYANNQITVGILDGTSGTQQWGWDTFVDYLDKGTSKSGYTPTEESDFIIYQTNLRSGTSDMYAKFNINGSANANVGGIITSVNVTNHFYSIGTDLHEFTRPWGTQHSEPHLQEILIYNTELSSVTRKKMEGYLAHKWGLTSNLPSDHPYKTTAPTNDWDPDDSTGLVSWFDASDKSTIELYNTSSVNTWFDKADANNYGQQTTDTNKPTYSDTARNSKPGIVFESSNSQRLALKNILKYATGSTESSIFVVGQSSTTGVWQDAIAWGDTDSPGGVGGQRSVSKGGTLNNHAWDTWASSSEVAIEWNSDAIVYQEFRFQSPADDYGVFIINGNTVPATVGTNAGTASTLTLRGNIGSNAGSSPGDFWDGVIQEILVFDKLISTQMRQKVEGYLAHKWGLASNLPSNHPYKTTAPKKTWEPDNIASLVGWYDAYDDESLVIYVDAGDQTLVNTWINKANTTITASQTTDTEKPLYSATARNSKPGLIFDGTNDRLPLSTITNLPTGQANSVIMAVGYIGSYPNYGRLIAWGGTTGTHPMRGLGTSTTSGYHTLQTWNSGDSHSGMAWNGDNIVYQAYLKTGSNMYTKYHINGSSTANVGNTLTSASTSTSRGVIGDAATTTDSADSLNGTIQEILIFNEELPDALRQKVEGYLAHKWGLTSLLPSDHPYKTEAP